MGNRKRIALFLIITVSLIGCVVLLTHFIFQPARHLSQTCSNGRPTSPSLSSRLSPQLRKLAEYESLCNGAVVDQLMFFTAMPTSDNDALQLADDVGGKLKEFDQEHITPLVVFEPSLSQPTILRDIHDGLYDTPLKKYYERLQSRGITSAQMGIWVLFPEANTPTWHTTNPDVFKFNITKVASLQKQYFPGSQISLLLNSFSYPDEDMSWSKGRLESLSPYTSGLRAGLIDSLGYQGFPRASPANVNQPSSQDQLDVSQFLPSTLAIDAATTLGVKNIWLNTGSFKQMYTDDPQTTVTLSAHQREAILTAILAESHKIQTHTFAVSINLFAANKSNTAEHIDWSYWHTGSANADADTSVIDMFMRQVHENHIGLSLYDQVSD